MVARDSNHKKRENYQFSDIQFQISYEFEDQTRASSRNKSARKEGKARSPIPPSASPIPAICKQSCKPGAAIQYPIPSIPLSIHPLSIPDYRSFCVMHNSNNPPFRTQRCCVARSRERRQQNDSRRGGVRNTSQQRRLYIGASRRLRGFRNDQLAGGASTRGKGETECERRR